MRWSRKIIFAYWLMAAAVITGQLVSVFSLEHTKYWNEYGMSNLVMDIIMITCLITTEILFKVGKQYYKYTVLTSGLVLIYLFFLIMYPVLNGAHIMLLVPVLLPLVYFEFKSLYIFGTLTMVLYIGVHFVTNSLGYMSWVEFLLIEMILGATMLLGRAVLLSAKELREHLKLLVKSEQKLIAENAISDKLLKMDALTGLYNHKTFHEYLENLIRHCETNGVSLQLAILDIDNFKNINDNYGHWVGDVVLKDVTARIMELMHPNDFAARYGGEEFAVIFTDKTTEEAAALAEGIRKGIEELPSQMGEDFVTISIGLCSYQPGDGKEKLFRNADAALYRAKRNGKNQVMIYNPDGISRA